MSTTARRGRQAQQITAVRVPQIIKYMGSKASILEFVVDGLNKVYCGGGVCDLFAGSCIVAGSIGRSVPVYANDIQTYSRTLGGFYLTAWKGKDFPSGEELSARAAKLVDSHIRHLPDGLDYHDNLNTLDAFNLVEEANRKLINHNFPYPFHLFARNYSGTWWSARQCVWIDALREVAEAERGRPHADLVMVCLLHAMAYSSQGTGHYAQYRDATTEENMADISIYRRRDLRAYFVRKYNALAETLPDAPPKLQHQITALDYRERLATLPKCTVYADPPYAFVHYSRFYHAMETICRYDFPPLQIKAGKLVKGRYREDRHQSPFCIRTLVPRAFTELFEGVAHSKSNLVLSYASTGMITFGDLTEMAHRAFGSKYEISTANLDHQHMTMGRKADRHRDVSEHLLLARRR